MSNCTRESAAYQLDEEAKKKTHVPTYSVVFVILFHVLIYVLFRGLNGRFPPPLTAREIEANPAMFAEEHARRHLHYLTSLGHRPTGSEANEIHAVRYIVDEIEKIRDATKPSHSVSIDVQEVSGTFDLGFLNHFTQYYENVKNILVRFEPARASADTKYILVNCHFDTVCQSPGASDDAASCCIMIEALRALSAVDEPFQHGVVFNFNGAEENILQASHGFITKHPWAKNVKAFVNLEGAGGGGWELLFQSGPNHPWLLKAYATSAPHPFASAVAQDIFQRCTRREGEGEQVPQGYNDASRWIICLFN